MRYQGLRDFYNYYIFGRVLRGMLQGCGTILEMGCGESSLILKAGIAERTKVTAVDIFQPYIEKHKKEGIYHDCICDDITSVQFKTGSFDAVVCMDVVEHIAKSKVIGSNILDNMKGWGRKVIITTPNGFTTNYHNSAENPFQNHLSCWVEDDFLKHGYMVRGLSGLKCLRKPVSRFRSVTTVQETVTSIVERPVVRSLRGSGLLR